MRRAVPEITAMAHGPTVPLVRHRIWVPDTTISSSAALPNGMNSVYASPAFSTCRLTWVMSFQGLEFPPVPGLVILARRQTCARLGNTWLKLCTALLPASTSYVSVDIGCHPPYVTPQSFIDSSTTAPVVSALPWLSISTSISELIPTMAGKCSGRIAKKRSKPTGNAGSAIAFGSGVGIGVVAGAAARVVVGGAGSAVVAMGTQP
mmetsp:Transcript_51699/g.122352  ORF Transcript_51699/g.122352 Transcript_51699/m.122352 type:complete len:206 (+) Transcript_51699:370-987(+)